MDKFNIIFLSLGVRLGKAEAGIAAPGSHRGPHDLEISHKKRKNKTICKFKKSKIQNLKNKNLETPTLLREDSIEGASCTADSCCWFLLPRAPQK